MQTCPCREVIAFNCKGCKCGAEGNSIRKIFPRSRREFLCAELKNNTHNFVVVMLTVFKEPLKWYCKKKNKISEKPPTPLPIGADSSRAAWLQSPCHCCLGMVCHLGPVYTVLSLFVKRWEVLQGRSFLCVCV